MYFIQTTLYYVYEKAKLNQYAIEVKKGNLLLFDEIDKEIRPLIKKMTYKHSCDPYFREDLEQTMMEFALSLCMKYEQDIGDFQNYCLRSVYFELKKYRKKYFEQNDKEFVHTDFFDTVYDERAHYETYKNILIEDNVKYLLNANILSEFEKEVVRYLYKGETLDEIAKRLEKNRKAIQNTLYRIEKKEMKTVVY